MTDSELTSVREITIASILALIAEGASKKDACEKMGISVSTFSRYVAARPGLVSEFVLSKRQGLQEQFSTVMDVRIRVLDTLLEKISATAHDMPVQDLFETEERLAKISENLAAQLGVFSAQKPEEESARQELRLPTIAMRPGQARIIQRDTYVIFNPEDRESPEVIDGTSSTPGQS
jgi:hypothetical protein